MYKRRKGVVWLMSLFLCPLLCSCDDPVPSATGQTTVLDPKPAEVRLANIFGDDMVLQRNKSVRVWGTCTGADTVTVSFKDQVKTATVEQGKWSVFLDAMPACSDGEALTVRAGETVHEIDGVLVGDVWLCSGQSNMEMAIVNCNEDQKEKIQQMSTFPLVRLTKIPLDLSYDEETDFSQQMVWKEGTVANNRHNSAYAFVFAARLQQELNIPIGIINSSYGGTDIEQWLSGETMDDLNLTYGRPSAYNCMISPLKGMAINGILWYQGENNVNRGTDYATLFEAYAAQCREEFNDHELPFVTTMLARFYDAAQLQWGPFRLKQWSIAQEDPFVEIVCGIDLGDKNDIHPHDKYEMGIRAAELTLNRIYGKTDLPGQSACASEITRSADLVSITFNNAESGLILSWGTTVESLVVTDSNAVAHEVNGRIRDGKLHISLKGIDDPLYVRYAYDMYPETINFYTGNGLPVAPFSLQIPQ